MGIHLWRIRKYAWNDDSLPAERNRPFPGLVLGQGEALAVAEKYELLVTAGSDYHGANKLVVLGDTNLEQARELPEGLRRFLAETRT